MDGVGAAASSRRRPCGGGSSSPTTPDPAPTPTPPPTGGGGNPATATITIGANGAVSPASVTIAPGGRVTFVNNHNQAHDMSSDPHPGAHAVPGDQSGGFPHAGPVAHHGNLNTARTCGFHDHNLPDNTGLQGRIIIQ